MRKILFLAISVLVSWVTGPYFFAACGASRNPSLCLGIRFAIFIITYLVLSAIAGGRKK